MKLRNTSGKRLALDLRFGDRKDRRSREQVCATLPPGASMELHRDDCAQLAELEAEGKIALERECAAPLAPPAPEPAPTPEPEPDPEPESAPDED